MADVTQSEPCTKYSTKYRVVRYFIFHDSKKGV